MNSTPKQPDPSRWRKRILFTIKLVGTVAMCAWIAVNVDWKSLGSELVNSNLWIIGLVVILRLGGLTMSAYKWQQLLGVHGLHYGLGILQRWYLVATFLNHFLPTSIGGDGYRIYKTLDNPKSKACALLAVFLERLTGLIALLLMGCIAAGIVYGRDGDSLSGMFAATGLAGFTAGTIVLWVLFRWRLVQRIVTSKICPKQIGILIRYLEDFRRHPGAAARAGMISFAFHANRIFVTWLVIVALGADCDPMQLTVAIALVNVIGMLPVSLGGFGLIEGSFMYLMGYYGLSHETGLSTMLLLRGLLIPMSLLGGYFYFVGNKRSDS